MTKAIYAFADLQASKERLYRKEIPNTFPNQIPNLALLQLGRGRVIKLAYVQTNSNLSISFVVHWYAIGFHIAMSKQQRRSIIWKVNTHVCSKSVITAERSSARLGAEQRTLYTLIYDKRAIHIATF